jgi:hypothetical protein
MQAEQNRRREAEEQLKVMAESSPAAIRQFLLIGFRRKVHHGRFNDERHVLVDILGWILRDERYRVVKFWIPLQRRLSTQESAELFAWPHLFDARLARRA